ncbi:hypothetical protein BAE44_0002517 [Dichanthelium oligosanthes]|uniref:No apical meristem-associated C-terminal domain-containing protein n=1 Tax=Dichanthelium oligosanthes TaxID=888268 RepID=A0A1E5WGD7_9POAL|nr:hypothetical protein BAE44_0002517 [Dichanthelium oligosanthes]
MDGNFNSGDWGGGGELTAVPPEEQLQHSPSPSPSPAGTAAARALPVRRNHKRSKNFSAKEDQALVRAWLGVSVDPVQGSERAAYWKRIHDRYHATEGLASDRNQNSITHRWSTIQDSVGKFERCLARITEGATTGRNGVATQDEIMRALTLYKSEDPNKSFHFLHCWNLLRTHEKWIGRSPSQVSSQQPSQKKQKTAPSSSPSSSAPCANEEDTEAAAAQECEEQPIGTVDEDADLSLEGDDSVDWGGGELMVSPPEEQHWPVELVTRTVRRNKKRTKNFSNREDEMLVSAWLNVSVDQVQGSERSTYWKRIFDYYHSNKDCESERNQNSIMHRWSIIQESVSKFERCLSRIEGTSQNGVTAQDEVSLYVFYLVVSLLSESGRFI